MQYERIPAPVRHIDICTYAHMCNCTQVEPGDIMETGESLLLVCYWIDIMQNLIYTREKRARRGGQHEIQPDLPPEYCHYRDEGCEFAKSCLNCPFPKCIYDQPRGRQRWLKGQRDREMIRLFDTDGKGIRELASLLVT